MYLTEFGHWELIYLNQWIQGSHWQYVGPILDTGICELKSMDPGLLLNHMMGQNWTMGFVESSDFICLIIYINIVEWCRTP